MTERTLSLQITEDLRRAVPLLKALLELVEAYDKIGSVEQAIDESNARLARARSAEAEFKQKFLVERAEIAALRQTATDVVAQAERDAKSVVDAARAHGEQIAAQAEAQVAELVVKADSYTDVLVQCETEIMSAQARLTTVRAHASETEAAIDAKKEELRKLLGG